MCRAVGPGDVSVEIGPNFIVTSYSVAGAHYPQHEDSQNNIHPIKELRRMKVACKCCLTTFVKTKCEFVMTLTITISGRGKWEM